MLEGNCGLAAAAGQVEDGGGGGEVGVVPRVSFFWIRRSRSYLWGWCRCCLITGSIFNALS